MSSLDSEKEGKGGSAAVIQYLSFLLNNEYYAFPIKEVQEIIQIRPVIPVPEFPEFAKGIINIRGTIIPIIDTRLRFHMPETVYGSRTCIIIVMCRDTCLGFIVDTINSVIDVTADSIMDVPRISERTARYVSGVAKIDKKIVMLLDTRQVLTDEMLKMVKDNIPEN